MKWLTDYRQIVAPKTTGRRLTSLRSFARWADWRCELLADYSAPTPAKSDPHPLPEGIVGIRRMIHKAKTGQQKALVALCGLCGLRVAEALAVIPSDFNLIDMELTVRGKGDKTRRIPVSPEAWSVLADPVARAFCDGGRSVIQFKDRFARALVTRLGERAGLKRRVSSHDLRATFATGVYDKTLDQRVVQELLGHASGTTTELYIGVSKAKMRAAVEGL